MATPLYIPSSTRSSMGAEESFWELKVWGISKVTWGMVLLVLGMAGALYAHTLNFPFQYDDLSYVVANPLVREPQSFWHLFDIAGVYHIIQSYQLPGDLAANFILRPVTYLTFALNYALGGLDPRGYRLVNILLHCANALLLFQLLRHFLKSAPRSREVPRVSTIFIPVVAALLFLVHPLQVESVTYIAQRFASLAAFFYLLTLWLYFKANAVESSRPRKWLRGASVVTLLLGMFSKEEVFTAPLLLVLLDHFLMGTAWKTALRRALPHLLCMAILPCVLMAIANVTTGGKATLGDAMQVACPRGFESYQYCYALTEVRVVVSYVGLLLVPNRMSVDWDIPLSNSVGDWRVLVSGAVILGMLAWAWFIHGRGRRNMRHALIFVSVMWYFVTIAVSSSIVPLPDVMAEHRVYLPSIGILTVLACYADLLRTRLFRMGNVACTVPASVVIWLAALCGGTLLRNEVWRSCSNLWADAVSKSPQKYRAWGNLGAAFVGEGRTEQGAACLVQTIQLQPDFSDAYRNLAGALLTLKKYPDAQRVCEQGLRFPGNEASLLYYKAQAQRGMGRLDDAIRSLQASLAIAPANFLTNLCLAESYAQEENLSLAKKYYGMAAALYPADKRLPIILQDIRSKERAQVSAN